MTGLINNLLLPLDMVHMFQMVSKQVPDEYRFLPEVAG
jgi:hypothetical protein